MREQLKSFVSQHWLMSDPGRYHVHRMPLLLFAIFLISGVWIGGRVEAAVLVWIAALFAALFAIAALIVQLRGMLKLASCLTMTSAFLLGISYGYTSKPATEDPLSRIASKDWRPCAVRVQITSAAIWQPNPNYRQADPKSEPWKTQWDVKCIAIRNHDDWVETTAYSRLSTEGRIDRFLPGDSLEVYGHFRKIAPSSNPGGFDFAQQAALNNQFISLRVESPVQLRLIGSEWGWQSLARIRGITIRWLDKALSRWVTRGQAPLAAALVFGQRQQVEWQDQQELMATGTLHMLSISGLHVEIVAMVLLWICIFLRASYFTTFLVLVLFTWSYAGLSGAEPPVIRAAVQVSIFAFARWIGGRTRIGNLLGGAAIVVVLLRASNLENIGVQLSFLAVATIGFFMSASRQQTKLDRLQAVIDETLPAWQLWLRRLVRKATELTSLSFWITIFTCPLVWTNFHVISPVAILLNVVISLPLTISLLSGLVTGLFGWITPVGWISGIVCGESLRFITAAVSVGNAIPLGHCWLPAPPTWWTIVFYLIATVWLFVFGRERLKYLGALLVIWILIGIAPWLSGPRGLIGALHDWPIVDVRPHELRCTFLSVGHGTSAVIELPSGEVWLYDAGHLGAAERSHQEIAASLWNLKTARIDRLVLSHADSDHYNATLGLLERFAIGSVISTPHFWQHEDAEVQAVINQLKNHRCNLQTWVHPTEVDFEQTRFQVLHPTAAWQGSSDNANSLCLMIEFAGKRILLPGDLEGAGLTHLVTLPARPCHVVMAPHHGSTTHNPKDLLHWCQPTGVVVSGGSRAVRPEVIKLYSQVPCLLAITHRDGAIQVRIDPSGTLSLWRWNSREWERLEP